MVHALSLAPFSSLSPTASQSQSQSSLASRHGVCLLCYASPHPKSQPHRITTKPKPPQTTTNFIPTSIRHFNQFLATLVRNKTSRPDPTIFSLYNCVIKTDGNSPDEYTYGYMIYICAKMNRFNLAFAFLGLIFKEGHKVHVSIFNSILNGLCSENRISEAAAMLGKMLKLGCVPDVCTYTILLKGLCSDSKTDLALQLLFKMVKNGGECEPDLIVYSTVIHGLCKEGELTKGFRLFKLMCSQGVTPDIATYCSLIHGFCKRGQIEKAKVLLHSMISKGKKGLITLL